MADEVSVKARPTMPQANFPPTSAVRSLPPARRWARLLAAACMLSPALAAAAVGCNGSSNPSPPAFCDGGFVRTVNGVQTCEGLCTPSACTHPGNVCVDNLCALPCTADRDCAIGEDCRPATLDGGGATQICQKNGRAPIGTPCPSGTECAALPPSCPDGSNCDYTQCGGGTCHIDPIVCGSDASCRAGRCDDGSRCTVPGCTADKCKPLVCLSSGVGDANAYCSVYDCTSDANCPGGYACKTVRDPHPICGAPASKLPGLCGIACTASASCVTAYGPGSTCTGGYCQAACVTAGADPTTTYQQGPFCTERNACKLRAACDPCVDDLDCSASPSMRCVSIGAGKYCASNCATDTDCASGFQCTAGACVPRAGSCTGTKGFCQPCHRDEECATGTYCGRPSSSSLERTCIAPRGTLSCMVDADCPTSPSGLHGKCLDMTTGSSPGDGVYHTCWFPYFAAENRFGCWAANSGAACGADADCVSMKCIGASASGLGACQ